MQAANDTHLDKILITLISNFRSSVRFNTTTPGHKGRRKAKADWIFDFPEQARGINQPLARNKQPERFF